MSQAVSPSSEISRVVSNMSALLRTRDVLWLDYQITAV